MADTKKTGLELLREPFLPNAISQLPKPTKAQTDEVKNNFKSGIRCRICGQWHHPKVVHLDYVGHAALTDRLLDCDPEWNWEPLSMDERGLPALDPDGGMWIKLTVCGVTRLGYGDAEGKRGGNAVKERIGDALRNAAMRFGAALDLWHKGDLHPDEPDSLPVTEARKPQTITADQYRELRAKAETAGVPEEKLAEAYDVPELHTLRADDFPRAMKRLQITIDKKAPADAVDADEIPY